VAVPEPELEATVSAPVQRLGFDPQEEEEETAEEIVAETSDEKPGEEKAQG